MRYPAPSRLRPPLDPAPEGALLSRFRLLLAITVLVALATALVACGGDDDEGGAGEDPQTVLNQTFSGDNEKVESGNLSLTLDVDVSGDEDATIDAELSGPFEDQGEGKVPKFALTVNVSGSGGDDDFSFDGGLTSTGDAAFVSYQGSDYEVDQSLFDQFAQQIEAGAGQQGQNEERTQQLLDALGVQEPTELLTNLTNEGTEDVEGTETVHISGDLDVDRTVEAVKGLIGNASLLGQLGGDTGELPDPDQLDQVKDAVKEAHFDLYSGVDDHILRRLGVTLSIEAEGDSADIGFEFTLSEVNEPQTIEAPANPKQFRDLLSDLGVPAAALGQLGGALGGDALGGGGGGGGGGGAPTLPSTPDADAAQRYLNCISQADTAADLQQCQSLAP
jgi:hypothetical protein